MTEELWSSERTQHPIRLHICILKQLRFDLIFNKINDQMPFHLFQNELNFFLFRIKEKKI